MGFFRSLFTPRASLRHYAHVDQQGICRAFKHCSQAPVGGEWHEISEPRLAWLGQPLPASARITPRTAHSPLRTLLAA